MATLCVASPLEDIQCNAFRRPKTLNILKTGLAEFIVDSLQGEKAGSGPCTEAGSRRYRYWLHTATIKDNASRQTPRHSSSYDATYLRASALVAELLQLLAADPLPYGSPPPPYEPTDIPPASSSDSHARPRVELLQSAPDSQKYKHSQHSLGHKHPTMADFGDIAAGVQSRGKSAKKAAKKAQQAKWMESDNEEGGQNAGDGGEEGGGGGGGDDGSAGAGGGAGGDDDWDIGGSKKNKKSKKKQQEEDEKKRQEEEEKKKKEEEEAAAKADPLSWADDANEANMQDEWSSAFTAKKDKKKKGRKGMEDSTASVQDPPTSTFHEISLDDSSPKLDFSFGGTDTKSKDKGGSGFGAWGTTWDFSSVGNEKKEEKNEKDTKHAKGDSSDFGDNNPWSVGNKAKTSKKKTTISSGFDFGDFGAIDEGTDFNVDGDLGDTKAADNAWGFNSFNSKEKKKKGADAKKEEAVTALPEPEVKEEDTWGNWGVKKETKKKGKKGAIDDDLTAITPPPPTAPTVPDPPVEEDLSLGPGRKDKKKGKKGVVEETVVEKKDEPSADADLGFDWGFGNRKDKTKKKGLISEVQDEPIVSLDDPVGLDAGANDGDDWMNAAWSTGTKKKDKKVKKGAVEDTFANLDSASAADSKTVTSDPPDDTWGALGTAKAKKDKKGRKGETKEEEPPPVPSIPDPPPADDNDIWGSVGKKDKKLTKKNKIASPEPTVAEPEPEPEPKTEDTWGTWGLSAKDKKKKETRRKPVAETAAPDPVPEPETEPEAKEEGTWNTWGLPAKDKKKKEKEATKKKDAEPVILDPEPAAETPAEDSWGTWGLSAKDKKKKEKETGIKKKSILEVEEEVSTKAADKVSDPAENDIWGSIGSKEKKKSTKKGKLADEPPPPVPTPPAQGLTPEPGPTEMPDFDDFGGDGWGLGGSKAKSSTKKGTLSKTTTLSGKSTKSTDTKTKAEDDGLTASPKEEKVSKKDLSKDLKDDTPAKAVKSMWGFSGSTSTSTAKSKLAREKEEKAKREAEEEQARIEAEKAAAAEAQRKEEEEAAAAAAAKKGSKSKVTSKLSKTTSKASDKSDDKKKKSAFDDDPLIELLEEPKPTPKEEKSSSKLKKSSTRTSDKDKKAEEEIEGDDYFGVWGSGGASSKKTAGKKDTKDTKETDTKKEINSKGLTNGKSALAGLSKDVDFSMEDAKPTTAKTSKTMLSGAGTKSKAVGSVAERIKAFEGATKEESGKKSKASLTKDVVALDEAAPSPKEEKKSSSLAKSKSTTATTSKSSKKILPVSEEKKSRDFVPGGFPGAFDEEDMDDLDNFAAAPDKKKTSTKKSKDDDKKATKAKTTAHKSSAMDDLGLLDEEPPKLPTPPPEDKKSAKKERTRVERTGASSSWGFWGAAPAPKKPTKDSSKSKDDVDSPPPSKKDRSPPGLSRSKSTRTPKEEKKEVEKVSRSSGSDKEPKAKRPEARAKESSRGMSFTGFGFGGPPPSAMRSKPTRRDSAVGSSRASSRRPSVDGGMVSPPPDDYDMNDKAAKLMGIKSSKPGRKESIKGKSKAAPDPYPIDDDDMVMINDPKEVFVKTPKTKTKTKREVGSSSLQPQSTQRPTWSPDFIKETQADGKVSYKQINSKTKGSPQDDDVVMVDGFPSGGEPMVTSGPDDMAFVDHPAPPKRSNTARKSGLFGSLFGAAAAKSKEERPKSSFRDRDTEAEDVLPIRTKDKLRRKTTRATDGEGFTTEAAETDADAETRRADRRAKRDAKEAAARDAEEADRANREQRRKERRDREKADLEASRTKQRDRGRKEQEADDQRRDEKRAGRRAKDGEPEVSAESAARREERRRLRAELEAQEAVKSGKDDKRRSRAVDDDDGDRRRRREGKKEKSSSRRKSTVLGDEYIESRNGGTSQPVPANKTSSWIHSQADDPPDLPPVVETIVDGERPRAVADEADRKRWEKEGRRKSKYAGQRDSDVEERRARRRTTLTEKSAGSDEKRGKLRRRDTPQSPNEDEDLGFGPLKSAVDGRPAVKSKRDSFFGKLF